MASSEARANSLTSQIAADRQRHESLAHDRQGAAQVREASQLEYDELHRQISELEQTRDELDEKAKNCARDIIERRRQRDAMNNELNELQRTLTQRRSRLEIIEQLLQKGEGLSAGTQKVLSGLDNPEVYSTGVRGLLASSIEVADRPSFPPSRPRSKITCRPFCSPRANWRLKSSNASPIRRWAAPRSSRRISLICVPKPIASFCPAEPSHGPRTRCASKTACRASSTIFCTMWSSPTISTPRCN
jgi:hypothetical protein